jgi:hypothetical protein
MKTVFSLCLLIVVSTTSHSQILKKVLNDIKNEAEWKMRSKARQKTNEAIDSLLAAPQKKGSKNSTSKEKPARPSVSTSTTTTNSKEENSTIGEGFITLSLSATDVFRGGTVIVTGTSVKYGNLTKVKMIVKGNGETEEKELKLFDNGSFAEGWDAEEAGEFTITVKSSDGKDQQTAKVKVYDIDVMDDLWVQDNIELTKKAFNKLKEEAKTVEEEISSTDKAELQKKMQDTKKKVDVALKLFSDLNTAAKNLSDAIGHNPMPESLASNLSELNDQLYQQQQEMQKLYDAASHKPYDNTVCEYLVMLNEACAAFSTFTNVWTKSVTGILKNITLDKGIPKSVDVSLETQGVKNPNTASAIKQPSKLFATALADAESLASLSGTAGFAGDLIQFATEHLMRTYCTVFTGTVQHNYKITYRNNENVTWWEYDYKTESAITLRYPKKNGGGSTIKMKGNIEGNATKFNFYQNVEVMDDFKEEMKGRVKLTAYKLYTPPAIPFATSQKDALGFGAVARGIATPAYFNIPIDAEFNVDANTMKVFLNDALIDFTPMVKYSYAFAGIAAGIPLITRVDFPINKARLTLNAVVSRNNELQVERDSKNNLIIKGSGERHIGSAADNIEHTINFNLTAKNDN